MYELDILVGSMGFFEIGLIGETYTFTRPESDPENYGYFHYHFYDDLYGPNGFDDGVYFEEYYSFDIFFDVYSVTVVRLDPEAPAPVPLPAAAPLVLAGLGALGFATRRRKSA